MIRRALPFVTGAALAAALVLSGIALWQTARLIRLRPDGIRTLAVVMITDLRAPAPERPWAEGAVRLFVSDPETGNFAQEVPYPPATLTEIWAGGEVAIAMTPGDPPQIAFWPTLAERRRIATLIALALTLAVAAVSGLTSRMLKAR